MKRVLTLLLLLMLTAGVASAASEVKINDLVEQGKAFDGQTVTITGEAVGDVMLRGDYGWINISDGTNDMGIWAPAAMINQIQHAGRYHSQGDRVRVTGEFRRADPEQGGDMDIHAARLEVLQTGQPLSHPVVSGQIPLAVLSLAVAGGLGFWVRRRFGRLG